MGKARERNDNPAFATENTPSIVSRAPTIIVNILTQFTSLMDLSQFVKQIDESPYALAPRKHSERYRACRIMDLSQFVKQIDESSYAFAPRKRSERSGACCIMDLSQLVRKSLCFGRPNPIQRSLIADRYPVKSAAH